jgi:amidase
MSEYVRRGYNRTYYAQAQNLRRDLRASYDHALSEFDVLLMPTTPFGPTLLPREDASLLDFIGRARDRIDVNTCTFDVTGHPALNVPCGLIDGLPVGMMLIARVGDDATLLQAARMLAAES